MRKTSMRPRSSLLALCVVALTGTTAVVAAPTAARTGATYRLRLTRLSPPRFEIRASLPPGTRLRMASTRPGDVPELLERGWPALVSGLTVADAQGASLALRAEGEHGWLVDSATSPLTIEYAVDLALLARHGYPAPREAAFVDSDHVVISGRALFVTTEDVRTATVSFELPRGWRAATAWPARGRGRDAYDVTGADGLEDVVVLTRAPVQEVDTPGFRFRVVPMKSWRELRGDVARVLESAAPRLRAFIGDRERRSYLVVLLPLRDRGAESYPHSLVLTTEHAPSRADRAQWGQRLAHEIFHHWNGWRLRGEDYAASRWFQEGLTDYAADLAIAASDIVGPEWLLERLSEATRRGRRLTTSLEAPGTTKGPPLYAAGELALFGWDVRIRAATGGTRGLPDAIRALWAATEGGRRPYGPDDLVAALSAAAPLDWRPIFEREVRSPASFPADDVLELAGLRLVGEGDDRRLVPATRSGRTLWREVAGR
jgi:predicted metalloprotease with PDZ domain